MHEPLTKKENWLAEQVVEIAIHIHKVAGTGLQEGIYRKRFCYELTKRDIPYEPARIVSQENDKVIVDERLQIGIVIDSLIVVELKTQEYNYPVLEERLLSYLELSDKKVGYILNFNRPLMKEGIRRIILFSPNS